MLTNTDMLPITVIEYRDVYHRLVLNEDVPAVEYVRERAYEWTTDFAAGDDERSTLASIMELAWTAKVGVRIETMSGPGGGNPVVTFIGRTEWDLVELICDHFNPYL